MPFVFQSNRIHHVVPLQLLKNISLLSLEEPESQRAAEDKDRSQADVNTSALPGDIPLELVVSSGRS